MRNIRLLWLTLLLALSAAVGGFAAARRGTVLVERKATVEPAREPTKNENGTPKGSAPKAAAAGEKKVIATDRVEVPKTRLDLFRSLLDRKDSIEAAKLLKVWGESFGTAAPQSVVDEIRRRIQANPPPAELRSLIALEKYVLVEGLDIEVENGRLLTTMEVDMKDADRVSADEIDTRQPLYITKAALATVD